MIVMPFSSCRSLFHFLFFGRLRPPSSPPPPSPAPLFYNLFPGATAASQTLDLSNSYHLATRGALISNLQACRRLGKAGQSGWSGASLSASLHRKHSSPPFQTRTGRVCKSTSDQHINDHASQLHLLNHRDDLLVSHPFLSKRKRKTMQENKKETEMSRGEKWLSCRNWKRLDEEKDEQKAAHKLVRYDGCLPISFLSEVVI